MPSIINQNAKKRALPLSEFAKITFAQFFTAGIAGQGLLNKYPTVCLVGARATLFPGVHVYAASQHANPKNTFANIKNYQNLAKSLFCFKKSEKEFDKLIFGNSEFVEHEI
jgi:hypothetical protein